MFIYWLCSHPSFGEKAKNWIEKKGNCIISSLTLYETLVIVAGLTNKSLKDKEFVKIVVNSIIGLKGLKVESLTKEDITKALEIMNDFGLDSLHLAVALRKNVKEIVSNDSDFDRTNIKRVF